MFLFLRRPAGLFVAQALLVALLHTQWASFAAGTAAGALLPLVRNPAMYQMDARIVTRELSLRKGSAATINDLTDDDLDDFAEAGFDALYLVGVWQTGDNAILNAQKKLVEIRKSCNQRSAASAAAAASASAAAEAEAAASAATAAEGEAAADAAVAAAIAQKQKELAQQKAKAAAEHVIQSKLEEDIDGQAPMEAAVGFPTAIVDYSVHTRLGGNGALALLRKRLHDRGLRLILDFVPNHMAADHPWTVTNVDMLVRGTAEDLAREPQNFYQVGEGEMGIYAHGKDPYFDGWEDTVQLNYASYELRQEMCALLAHVAGLCDGVRCDMAMLQCPDVFKQTWGEHLAKQGISCDGLDSADTLFWPAAIKAARAANPDFLLIGEVYWGREHDLHSYGFDFTLDKVAYEQLTEVRGQILQEHLSKDPPEFHRRCVRYLETHEEKRAAAAFTFTHEEAGTAQHMAAIVAVYTLPGMRLFHDGQLHGRKEQVPLFLAWRDNYEVRDIKAMAMYSRLLSTLLTRPELREGEWAPCVTSPSMDQNPSYKSIVSHVLWDKFGNCLLIVVNYNYEWANGHVTLPPDVVVGKRYHPIPNCYANRGNNVNFLPNSEVENGPKVVMRDLLDDKNIWEREAAVMRGRHGGIWFDLKPWQAHAFEISFA